MTADPVPLNIPLDRSDKTTALIYEAQPPARRAGPFRLRSELRRTAVALAEAVGPATLILAHGAGAGQRSPFMISFARELAERGLDVVTFNFLYTEQRRRVPDRLPQLVACYRAVIAAVREHVETARQRLFIGGKSMGGRVATHVAAEDPAVPIISVKGIVLLGYPLHPPGRPDQLRDAHLPNVRRPMLFVQGSRDAFGTPAELKPIVDNITPLPTLHTVEGGDHSFKIPGRDATKQAAVYSEIQNTIIDWIART